MTDTGKIKRRMIFLALFLTLTSLPMATYMIGCGSSGGGEDPGGISGQQPGPMSMEALEQFWLDTYGEEQEKPFTLLKRQLLAKAEPDECFFGIGDMRNTYDPYLQFDCDHNKVNQAYLWGLAKFEDGLWFGTGPNVQCLGIAGYLGIKLPHETGAWVCEFGQSQFSPPLPDSAGDWRPPRIFLYNTVNKTLTEKTPDDPRISTTLGIRSSGAFRDIAILGGPSLLGGLNLFAFSTETGEYLGSANLPEYSNIRKWLVVNDVLYSAVGNTDGGGSVLRWVDDPSDAIYEDDGVPYPFGFKVVGSLDGFGAELAYHEGCLFVSTWPGEGLAGSWVLAGIWMSPEIPAGGLNESHAESWKKVWQADDYESDLITAATYGGGALASFDGYLYWGTMHVPLVSTVAHFNFYGPPENMNEALAAVLGTYRAISIFRGRNFGTQDKEIDLVYGMPRLPVYNGANWRIKPNNMGNLPLWGLSGFGNFFNNNTWAMAVYSNQLFVGTMDWSYLPYEILNIFLEAEIGYVPDRKLRLPRRIFGADLWRFPSADSPAIPESLAGVGNYTSYGIRNIVSGDALYLGMANPMNLLTDPEDGLPEGGWELIKLQP